MNKKEKELFLELCKFCKPNKEKIEKLIEDGYATNEVLGTLFANRVAGVACGVLNETELLHKTNREFRNSLFKAKLINEKINEDYDGCVKYVSAELEDCGVPYALLKGAYLCNWYPKGYRTSNDVDVLIVPDDVGKVSAKLKLAGFKQGEIKNGIFVPATRQQIIESKMTRGETVPFIKETKLPYIKYLEVDVNFSLDYKNSNDTILKEILSRTQTVDRGSYKFRTLDTIDFLLHLCVHLYKEATTLPWIRMNRDMTFYKYCDIYALLINYNDNFKEIIERSKANGMETELAYCIKSIENFFNVQYGDFDELLNSVDGLDNIVAPQEKKIYRYKETEPVKRFFVKDRIKLLEDIEK